MRGKTTQEKKKKKSPAENDLKGQGEACKTTFKHSLFLRPGPGTTYLPGINDLFNRPSSSKKRKKGGKKDAWGNDRSQRTIGRDAVPSIRLRLLSWQPTAGGKEWGGGRASAPDKFTGNERAARYGDGGAVSQISVTGSGCAVRAARAVARARAGPSETQRQNCVTQLVSSLAPNQ